jgi:prevent-host-death family protein
MPRMLPAVSSPRARRQEQILSFCLYWHKLTIMISIAVADAKARFSELLDRVSRGERFLVLRHGRPTAALVPASAVAEPAPTVAGLAAVAGALATWEDLEAVVEDIYAARRHAQDRPVPPLD